MRNPSATDGSFLEPLRRQPDLALVVGIVGIIFVILVPLPPALVDPLLILNITVSVVVLMAAACVARPLDFSVFPSLILIVTFYRLALNIATTRLILGNAADGPHAAGSVVQTFGGFVGGANAVVGLVIFSVIVLVQFVVITRGATRVSEVAARFQLDALPGKQLSVDGDLAAGLIDKETARARRQHIAYEADFYGAMDGTSKFVRGDAIAAMLIVLVNLVGGMAVGAFYHGMSLSTAADVFSRLTIGDGLVSQIPALMVSVAAALLVTRNPASSHLAKDIGRQLLFKDEVLFVAALFLLLLLPTGLPAPALLVTALACAFCGWTLRRERILSPSGEEGAREPAPHAPATPALEGGSASLTIAPLELEIGYRLLPLIDEERGGDLIVRLGRLRENLAADLGLVLPAVQVKDSRRLRPFDYVLRLRGNALGRWRARPDGFLAVQRRPGSKVLDGESAPPLNGNPAWWISESQADAAVDGGYEIQKPALAVAGHLEFLIRTHATEMLHRQDVCRLLEELRRQAPGVVDDLVPEVVKISELQTVLQELLREGVSIRDLETVLETLESLGGQERTTREKVEAVRRAIRRTICAGAQGDDGTLQVVVLEPALEERLVGALERVGGDTVLALDSPTEELVRRRVLEELSQVSGGGGPPTVLCVSDLRSHLSQLIRGCDPAVAVLSYEEVVEDTPVEVRGTVRLDAEECAPVAVEEAEVKG